MSFQEYATLISLVLTFVLIQMCYEVIYPWRAHIKDFFRGHREPFMYATAGFLIHFTSSFLDNIYWGVVWSYWFNDDTSEVFKLLYNNGSFPNIFFRQLGTITAGYFYAKASYLTTKSSMRNIHTRLTAALVVGLLYALWLTTLK